MRPNPLLAFFLALSSAAALAQQQPMKSTVEFDRHSGDNYDDAEKIPLNWWPHPYLDFGFSAMPGGYAPIAEFGEGGFALEARHVLAQASAAYDNGYKNDDNDQPNPKGHDRYLRGDVYWRLTAVGRPRWFLGAGYRWSQLSTTNYTKGGTRPEFGGGYDFYWDRLGSGEGGNSWFSARFTLNWMMAGSDWQNGGHGAEFSMVLPRPIEKRHVFFTYTMDLLRYHDSVTEPSNIPLTQWQRAQHFMDGTCSLGLMLRFH